MSDSPHKSNKTMDNSVPLFRLLIWLSERARGPLPHPPSTRRICPCVWFRRKCCHFPSYQGGEVCQLTPVRRCLDRQSSAPAVAGAPPTIEVTLILAPLKNSAPQRIGNGSTAAIHVSIDAAALADSGNDDDNDDDNDDNDDNDDDNNDNVEYSLFGEAPIPSRKLGEGQDDDDDDGPPPFEY